MHWRTESSRHNENEKAVTDDIETLRRSSSAGLRVLCGPFALFVVTVGVDSVMSLLLALHVLALSSGFAMVMSASYMIAQLGASLYFFYAAWSIKALVRDVKDSEDDAPLRHMCVHASLFV